MFRAINDFDFVQQSRQKEDPAVQLCPMLLTRVAITSRTYIYKKKIWPSTNIGLGELENTQFLHNVGPAHLVERALGINKIVQQFLQNEGPANRTCLTPIYRQYAENYLQLNARPFRHADVQFDIGTAKL